MHCLDHMPVIKWCVTEYIFGLHPLENDLIGCLALVIFYFGSFPWWFRCVAGVKDHGCDPHLHTINYKQRNSTLSVKRLPRGDTQHIVLVPRLSLELHSSHGLYYMVDRDHLVPSSSSHFQGKTSSVHASEPLLEPHFTSDQAHSPLFPQVHPDVLGLEEQTLFSSRTEDHFTREMLSLVQAQSSAGCIPEMPSLENLCRDKPLLICLPLWVSWGLRNTTHLKLLAQQVFSQCHDRDTSNYTTTSDAYKV